MGRYQRGHVFEQHGAFHVRYYTTEIVDGRPKRVQRSERLCAKDNKHHSKSCKSVQTLVAGVMGRINNASAALPDAEVAFGDFWDQTYRPHIERNLKASTVHGYKQIWNQHLKSEFAPYTLAEYRPRHVRQLLTKLIESGLGQRTVAHVRALMNNIFSHAHALELIDTNPVTGTKPLVKPNRPDGTHAYTLEEAEAISNALIDHPQAQIVFCLAAFMGLRPGEISALKWPDIDADWIHIRRAAWRGFVGTTKTEESVASVPLISPIREMLTAWRVQSVGSEWLFPSNRGDHPLDISGYAKRVIALVLKAKNLKWHGLYSGRRGAATLLVQLTGNAVASQYVLRHKNLATTTAFYIKPVQTAGLDGMKLVEAELAKRKALAAANNGQGQ